MTDVVFECRLNVFDRAERSRYQALRSVVNAAVVEARELPEGYAVRLASDPEVFREVAEWITLERRCCPFLALSLAWSVSDTVWLTLTGGTGVKAYLAEQLDSRS